MFIKITEKRKLNENFKIQLQIDTVVDTSSTWIFKVGEQVLGIEDLRSTLTKFFNQSIEFIDKKLEGKKKPESLIDLK